jgi:Ca2+-binding EF-hand superfamily protein
VHCARIRCLQDVLWLWLDLHLQRLKPVANAFKYADKSDSGHLDCAQFTQFCQVLHPDIHPSDAETVHAQLDLDGSGKISFDTCARALLQGV